MAGARRRLSLFALAILLLIFLTSPVAAASRASFCKCTCNKNSTIIPLDSADAPDKEPDEQKRQRTCADCNRQFCLGYDLPILSDCKVENKGKEEDIVATCFQRDSAKDQAVVYSFILLTIGLLAYAALKPYMSSDKRRERTGQPAQTGASARDYAPLPS